MSNVKIKSALISVFHKEGLDKIINLLDEQGVAIYSTGGTQKFIESLGVKVHRVEDLTSYPSILDGRVKTLHPKVFGGILARREVDHLAQLDEFEIPTFDLVIVDLYPFQETVRNTEEEKFIIEKIDIGGISLIRAAAKNYQDVVIVPSQLEYNYLEQILEEQLGEATLADRKELARRAFKVSSDYDVAIFEYFDRDNSEKDAFKVSLGKGSSLRYGENPHQQGIFFGEMEQMFDKLGGKELSFNNLVDIDAAVALMAEFKDDKPTFAVLKHTNACGVATSDTILKAWKGALAGDPVSAFGGILISNTKIDLATAEQINKIFYEVVIAPAFDQEAQDLLLSKKKRVVLKANHYEVRPKSFKSLLNGVIVQDTDLNQETAESLTVKTNNIPKQEEISDLIFANKVAKHLKSNTIVLAKNKQLLGMGCGQTSRVDALKQAINKAIHFGFNLDRAVMASDAFFPFPDCVEIADKAGVTAIIQPGGSIKDQLSIDYCNEHNLAMVFTGVRHFKH
jgi:phosphoribosylaminoimidazolecarboxamide formyltransferase/IMP cyclohydrolase